VPVSERDYMRARSDEVRETGDVDDRVDAWFTGVAVVLVAAYFILDWLSGNSCTGFGCT
jgi:hypothetical protein